MPKHRGRLILSRWARWNFVGDFARISCPCARRQYAATPRKSSALSGMALGGRGVDTTEAALAALPAAQALARQIDCIVVVTGEIDYVTNGQRTLSIPGGDPLMTRIVGTGCALSAVVAASCALPGAALDNVASACCWMKLAGQAAAERSEGPGSFIPAFLDALYHLDVEAANATN